jgi:hypothetical protein
VLDPDLNKSEQRIFNARAWKIFSSGILLLEIYGIT